MARATPRKSPAPKRPSKRATKASPGPNESEAARQWRDAEQQAAATESAAQELLDRAGSPERAKDAIDRVDGQHPP